MKQGIGILGYGEVGQAIAKFYKHYFIKDLKQNNFPAKLDILHICLPYNKNFIQIVVKNIKQHNPKIIIIHSTVAIGTTSRLQKMFKNKIVVHSPIRGVHPNLYQGIKTFVKYIGAMDKKSGLKVSRHLKLAGIRNTRVLTPPETTEALKLWSTTQYGLMIILAKEIYRFCQKYGLDFDSVYVDANETYNQGYKKLKMENVIRPVLKHIDGKIGGHCIIPNAKIIGDDIAKFILDKNKEY